MNDKKLYVYYKDANGNEVPIKDFYGFNALLSWCDRNCDHNSGHYRYKGNLVLCGYHLGR